ncbi:MAG: hypothetical protein QOF18_1456 [Frankiaceae bacterium]|nr:hypothetical protein [Frankiaceae bacterium]
MVKITRARGGLRLVPAFGLSLGMWLWLLNGWGGPVVIQWADEVGAGVFSAAATGVMIWRLRRQPRGARRAWLLLAIGSAAWTAGEVVWCWYELVLHRAVPTPSIADVGFLLLPAFAVLALCSLKNQREARYRRLLDTALVGGSALLIWWLTVLENMHPANGDHGFAFLVTLAYPLLDVVLITTAVLIAARAGRGQPRFLTVGLALAFLTVADSTFAWLTAAGHYASGSATDAAFMTAFALLATAPLMPAGGNDDDSAGSEPNALASQRSPWPFVPFALGIGVSLVSVAGGRPLGLFPLFLWALLAGCLVGRQYLALRDNQRLLLEIRGQRDQLGLSARTDPLTGLVNRTVLVEMLEQELAKPDHPAIAVAVLDINDFKLINDSHGHDTGDAVLSELSRRLSRAVRSCDTVARLGGDEFAVVAVGVDDDGRALADRLLAAFSAPVSVGARNFAIRASVGVVIAADTGEDAHTLLAHADVAMYQAKDAKDPAGAPSVLLTGPRRVEAVQRLRLREETANPDLDQFFVAYQPVVDLATGRIRGLEALLRWTHPEFGSVGPADFIPLAEQVGSIGLLGDFVLRTAVADLAALHKAHPDHRLAVGVNIAPVQLTDPALLVRALTLMARHDLDPSQLVLEVTEEALVLDFDVAATTIATLMDHGFSVAVDDFGTGYSSLRYLQRFMLDVLKIDRSFVGAMTNGGRGPALVQSVIQMSSALDLQVIAEGIETIDQLRMLQSMNCELGQGFLFSPAVRIEAIEALLRTGHTYPVGAGEAAPLVPPQATAARPEALERR